jgi:hypothetical protein
LIRRVAARVLRIRHHVVAQPITGPVCTLAARQRPNTAATSASVGRRGLSRTVVRQVPVGVVVAASILEPDLQCCADIRGDGEGC